MSMDNEPVDSEAQQSQEQPQQVQQQQPQQQYQQPQRQYQQPQRGQQQQYQPPYNPSADLEGVPNDVVGEIQALVNQHGLKPEQARQFVSAGKRAFERIAQENQAREVQLRQNWEAQIKSDPEVGGARLPETLTRAARILRNFGDPQIFQDMKAMGLGYYPPLIKFLSRIDKLIGEDKYVMGAGYGRSRQASLDELYPNTQVK